MIKKNEHPKGFGALEDCPNYLILNRYQDNKYKKFLLGLFVSKKIFRSYGYARFF